jgi:hypothetical protein
LVPEVEMPHWKARFLRCLSLSDEGIVSAMHDGVLQCLRKAPKLAKAVAKLTEYLINR